MDKFDKIFVNTFTTWCLFGVGEDKKLYPLFSGEGRFWRGGDNVSLAAYDHWQPAYAARKKAKKDLMSFKNIIVRKIISTQAF